MIYLIEGARNSGKTFISSLFSMNDYKFPFTQWFGDLKYEDSSTNVHDFAVGKEIMLLDLNKKGFIKEMICDRGILTVFVWAVLSNRISESEASNQMSLCIKDGLLDDVKILYVKGRNPNPTSRDKDFWDHRENEGDKERLLYGSFINMIKNSGRKIEIIEVENLFDQTVKAKVNEIKNVWNIN